MRIKSIEKTLTLNVIEIGHRIHIFCMNWSKRNCHFWRSSAIDICVCTKWEMNPKTATRKTFELVDIQQVPLNRRSRCRIVTIFTPSLCDYVTAGFEPAERLEGRSDRVIVLMNDVWSRLIICQSDETTQKTEEGIWETLKWRRVRQQQLNVDRERRTGVYLWNHGSMELLM